MPVLKADYSNIDHAELAAAIGLKADYIAMLLESFKDEAGGLLDAMCVAIEEMEHDSIRSAAHAIKGSSGNIKLSEVYEMAKEIEHAAAEQRNDFEYKIYFDAIKKAVATIS